MAPLITVIIPTYNRATIIHDALDSVLKQSYQNWECIVVDDFSEDDTEATIAGYTTCDKRVKYTKNQNTKGAPGARNTGIDLAQGDFVAFLDSDDFLATDCLLNQINAHLAEDLDMVISLQRRFSNGLAGNLVNVPSSAHPLVRFFSLKPHCDIPWINSFMIRKDFLALNKIRWDDNIHLYQDIQFNLAILTHRPQLRWINSVDSFWTYSTETKSIGKDASNFVEKHVKLLETYTYYYRKLKTDKSLPLSDIKKQFRACIICIIFMLVNLNAGRVQLNATYKICSNSLKLDSRILVFIYLMLADLKKHLLSRATLSFIKFYLQRSNRPVIIKGTFCTIENLKVYDSVF